MFRRLISALLYALTTAIGGGVLLAPLLWPALFRDRAEHGPLLLTLLLGAVLVALLIEAQQATVDTKVIALLGVLVAINSVLRFAETAIPGPGGFSPVFFLILITGYLFGARFGFLMGVLTLLVSALVTGGVGPWLPAQMLAAGWTGLSAPLLRWPVRLLRAEGGWLEVVMLAGAGALWGLLYGVIANLWFWPFLAVPTAQAWAPDLPAGVILRRYAAFYAATSLVWDLIRAGGNVALLALFGAPTLWTLRRFRRRFTYIYQPYQPQGVEHPG